MKTIVILSGGMDSTVLAYYIKQLGGLAGCVSVNYGQRHGKELVCAAATCQRLNVPHTILDMQPLRHVLNTSALTSNAIAVPEGHYAEESMRVTVVPNRNMIILALAVGVAIAQEAEAVAYGAHSGDHAIYPDCRPEFAAAMEDAVNLCDYNPPRILRPFIDITKAEVVARGVELGVRFGETWTCYKGEKIACGRCGTCVERLEAFSIAKADDPLHYLDRNYWKSITRQPESPKLAL